MLFNKRRIDDISVSIQEHIEERIDELVDEGLPRPEAERKARREFGNPTLLEERSREVWQWQRLETLLVDLRHIGRRLRRSPGFAITVVLTLAIGIGANTAVFSVLNSVLLRPLPYPEPQQLVSLHLNAPGAPGLAEFRSELRLSASMYFTFTNHNRAFQSLGIWGPGTASITGIAQPEQVDTAQISSGVLETLKVPALHGQWLMATIGVVMLIACTNVANLLLVRADVRQQELAVRSALGAGRWRIARELLLESVTLGLVGGAVGVAVAYGGLRLLTAIGPADLPRLSEISLDGWSIAFTLILSVLSGLFFGAIPVLRYAPSRQRVNLLGTARTTSVSHERLRARNLLVVAQVSMALVLLIGAVLMIRTFNAMRNVDPGFSDPASLQVMRLSIPDTLVRDATTVFRTQNTILDQLASIPGVSSVGFAAAVPMSGTEPSWDQIFIKEKTYVDNNAPMRLYNYVSPGYFHTAGTRMIAGRDFTWAEIYGQRPVGIISEGLARELWGSPQAAIGKQFQEYPPMPWHEIVGVVQDVRENGVDQVSPATVYWPSMMPDLFGPGPVGAQRSVYFAIRSHRAGTQDFINEMQHAVWSVNGNLPVADISTMQDIYGDSMARTSFTLVMLAIAGTMAFALGILGIYGVISYAVSQRTREIGIRMALGAKKSELAWMFVRSALVLTAIGTALGLVSATALMRLMRTLLFGISPLDPLTFAAVPVALIAAAALASYLPARRTAAINPVEALRAE